MSFKCHITSLKCILLRWIPSVGFLSPLQLIVLRNNEMEINHKNLGIFLLNVTKVLIFKHVHKSTHSASILAFGNAIYLLMHNI